MTDTALRLAGGGLQVVLARAAFYALGYLATVALARGLGPVDYGAYGVVLSVLVWVEQVSRFTLAPAAAKLIPQVDDGDAVATAALGASLALFTALLGALWIVAPLAGGAVNVREGPFLLRLAALDLPVFGAYVACQGICQGRRQFPSTARAEMVYSAAKLAGVLALLAAGLTVAGALVVNVLASVAGLAALAPRVLSRLGRWSGTALARLLPTAARLGFYMLALQTVAAIDLWSLTALTGPGERAVVGAYVAARTVALVPSLVLLALSEVLLPSLSGALALGDRQAARRYLEATARCLVVLLPPLVLLAALTGEALMTFLYSAAYAGAGAHLGIQAAAAALFALLALFGAALNAAGRSTPAALALLGLAPVAAGLNLVLVPARGPAGAAAAQMLTALAGAVLLGRLVRRSFGPFLQPATLGRVGAAAAVTALAGAWLSPSGPGLLLYYAGALALYVAVLAATGELGRREVAVLRAGVRLPALRVWE